MKKRSLIKSFLCACAGLSSMSYAFNVQKFQPLLNQEGGVTLLGAQFQEAHSSKVGFFLNGVRNPLEFRFTGSNTRSDSIVNWFMTADVLGSFALNKRVSFMIDVPVHLYQNLEQVNNASQKDQFRMGDILLQSNIVLKSNTQSPVGLAVVPFVTLPTGRASEYVGDASMIKNVLGTVGGRVVVDSWLGSRNYVSLNAGYRARKQESLFNMIVDDEMTASAGYAFVASQKHALDVFTEVNTSTMFRSFYKNQASSPAEWLGGIRKASVNGGFSGVLGGGLGINSGYGVPDWRVFTTLQYSPNSGRMNRWKPESVAAPVVAAAPVKKVTKLELSLMNDKGEKLEVPYSITDSKGMKVVDATGSQWSKELDAGVYILNVQGPANKEPMKKIITINEGDTVIENIQLASVAPVQAPAPKIELRQKIDLKGKIFFDPSQATIKAESFKVLDDAVEKLKVHTEFKKVQIEAHTDSMGDENKNQSLSEARAKAVVDYLVQKGIDSKRLDSKGYGESMPIASDKTKIGRAQNRRVEFVVVE